MVDLGQKGWKKFHLFYWNKVKNKELVLLIDFFYTSSKIFVQII